MGECISYFVDPSQFTSSKRKVVTIPWPHDFYFMELEDGELCAYILSINFEQKTPATDQAKRIAQFGKMRRRPLALSERGMMTRALRETKIIGMTGNDFLTHARAVIAQKDAEREERLQSIQSGI